MTKRTGLGRGLEALIPKTERDFAIIPIERVYPNPRQPRENFDDAQLEGLAASIKEVGLLQPIVVRSDEDGRYTLIAGERRLRAAKSIGLAEIPVIVRDAEDDALLTEALIENLQREDLGPLEEAAAYQQLLDEFGLTHEEIGRRVGKSRSAVTNALRLLQLPAVIQGMLERRELSTGHARALLGLEDRRYAEHIAERAVQEGWSVRRVEDAVRARNTGGSPTKERKEPAAARPVAIVELERRLQDRLDTKVHIRFKDKKGRISIDFASLDDLERIFRDLF